MNLGDNYSVASAAFTVYDWNGLQTFLNKRKINS